MFPQAKNHMYFFVCIRKNFNNDELELCYFRPDTYRENNNYNYN